MLVIALACTILAQAPPPISAPANPASASSSNQLPPLDDDPGFIQGRKYYANFEFEKAAFRFRNVARVQGRSPAEGARAHLWLGLALAQGGDDVSARDAFADALALDPNIALPADAPPTVRVLFQQGRDDPRAARSLTAAKPEAHRLLTTTIVGASVTGAGLLLVGGGVATGILAQSQANTAAQERFQDDAAQGFKQAEGTAAIGNGLLVVGGLAGAVGAVVVVIGPFLE